jgi:hypothetical protein
MRAGRSIAKRCGILQLLERRANARTALWLRSLFAIYDLADMVYLDLPWWTFSATQCVEKFLLLRPNARVFEYGSGASTIWLALRAGSIESVEHDRLWAEQLDQFACEYPNIKLNTIMPSTATHPICASRKPGWHGHEFKAYVDSIRDTEGLFDLIIVDGRARADCLKASLPHLRHDGLIIFDDSNRSRYQQAIQACGLARQDAHGLKPGVPYPTTTTLLVHDPALLVRIGASTA